MTWTSPPPTWQRRHSDVLTDGMAADSAAAAVGPEAGTLAMEAMEATAMAAEVPWASIGTFLLMFRGVLMMTFLLMMMSGARGWMAKFRRFRRKQEAQEKKGGTSHTLHDNRNPETRKSEEM